MSFACDTSKGIGRHVLATQPRSMYLGFSNQLMICLDRHVRDYFVAPIRSVAARSIILKGVSKNVADELRAAYKSTLSAFKGRQSEHYSDPDNQQLIRVALILNRRSIDSEVWS